MTVHGDVRESGGKTFTIGKTVSMLGQACGAKYAEVTLPESRVLPSWFVSDGVLRGWRFG